ncbi:sigma-70 family RNA polymerase sigma factor, partial [Nannocystis bainbridge]
RSEPQPDDARIRTFRELYLAEFPFVWAAARRFGVPPNLVEDAVQDVFMTAYRRLDEVRFEVSPRAWLHGVTRRIAARYRRTAARLNRRLAAVAAVPTGPLDPPQDRFAAAEQLERLLARLSGSTRAVFEMAELHGMSGPEIAGELGIPVATVYSRVRLAREQLQRELGGAGLERELSAARARETPPPAAVERTWAAMLPGLWTTRTGVGLAVLASTRAAVMTTLVVATGAVAIAWPKGQVDERPALVARQDPAPRLASTIAGGSAAPAPLDAATPESPEPPVLAPVTTPLRGQSHDSSLAPDASGASYDSPLVGPRPHSYDSSAVGPHADPSLAPSPPAGSRDPSAARPPSGSRDSAARDGREAAANDDELAALARTAPHDGDPDQLAAEIAVLDRARADLAGGAIDSARARLTEHAQRFPAGPFADLRDATEVELLCRQGDHALALARATALVARHPRSAVAQRFKNFSCPE